MNQQVNAMFQQLDTIHHSYFYEDHLDDKVFDIFLKFCQQFSFEFVHAVLDSIICDCSEFYHWSTFISLTDKFYAKMAFDYIQRHRLQPQIKNLTSDDETDEKKFCKLMLGAIVIEQWFSPQGHYPEDFITNFIAETSDKVTKYYKSLLAKLATDGYSKYDFDYQKCIALSHVFFEELHFEAVKNYCCLTFTSVYNVIAFRRGLPVTLSIIYIEIARRLDFKLKYVERSVDYLRWEAEELNSEDPAVSDRAK